MHSSKHVHVHLKLSLMVLHLPWVLCTRRLGHGLREAGAMLDFTLVALGPRLRCLRCGVRAMLLHLRGFGDAGVLQVPYPRLRGSL